MRLPDLFAGSPNPAADTLPVSELFHGTLQGEGPAAGRTASFLRLMGCNLSCAWCDSPYTWDASRFDLRAETTHRTPDDLAAELAGHPGILVITGGEPLLQQGRPGWARLLELLHGQRRTVHVETNGTVLPDAHTAAHVDLFMVSPKLPNAGAHRGHQSPVIAAGWSELAELGAAALKVVCEGPDDVTAAVTLADGAGFPREQTWVMPEGTTTDALQARWPAIATAAARHGICASHRLHVLAWGDARGH